MIIVVAVLAASFVGHGMAALIVVFTALLAAAVAELVRAVMRYWMRVA
ncbi:hypothetical protein [Streptomyces sp. MAR4 CNX-425]